MELKFDLKTLKLGNKKRKLAAAIIGSTATGKTALSISAAKKLFALNNKRVEIISVDSRQIYRYMDIGTEKVSAEIRREIPHHLIDIADPDEYFSVSDFVDRAVSAAERIYARGALPLFVGGTPYYYNALFNAAINKSLPCDPEVRKKYESYENLAELHAKLSEVDPVTAKRLHPNDIRRVSRALEIYEITGKAPSELYKQDDKLDFGFDVFYIGLRCERAELFSRIEKRLRIEFESGFIKEVAWLIEHGFDERFTPMQGLGYKELAKYYRGEISLDEAFSEALKRTKAFCRRQETWFKNFTPAIWFDVDAYDPELLAENAAKSALIHFEKSQEELMINVQG